MCKSCNAVTINGVYCHEFGCPDKDKNFCKWCGNELDNETENFCDDGCARDYYLRCEHCNDESSKMIVYRCEGFLITALLCYDCADDFTKYLKAEGEDILLVLDIQ